MIKMPLFFRDQRHFFVLSQNNWLGIFPVIEYICNSVANAKQLRIIGVGFSLA